MATVIAAVFVAGLPGILAGGLFVNMDGRITFAHCPSCPARIAGAAAGSIHPLA